MKVEIINPSTGDVVDTYSVPALRTFDFREWADESEVEIAFNCLLNTVENLDSKDRETQEPISNPREVDFYLPDPIKNKVISQSENLQTNTEGTSDQIPDEVIDTVSISMPVLKSSTILMAVVQEILQNHPHSDYKVRISDDSDE